MAQTLIVVVLFIAAVALLPWLIRRLQQRQAGAAGSGPGAAAKVLSAVPVGPQQRVVTVEVGPEHQRVWLVLGVTAQQVQCLHVIHPSAAEPSPLAHVPPPHTSFAGEMVAATRRQDAPAAHG
ncbi:FliO/MopB family protein [Paracidovorax cattleyae]|uniref:Flagellar protein FliO/FliZ n=1 Tax=Paracidovorax cattleyae TaxID=80868 RepID=A0A1H0TPF9_9BURK|nr:flagellar biosynthetic protein FliO [Paracidovorax cattleyae]AVS75884.1 flagellar biosynthesis protein FliO [Paracidovorax cattleyae]MBF9266812.1 flagellar biosynthetic protein FliO [Paracidovorax cattleyae]SDP55889.1 flagellar protein FliO/FliZ [Paracidovorax cattleyae]